MLFKNSISRHISSMIGLKFLDFPSRGYLSWRDFCALLANRENTNFYQSDQLFAPLKKRLHYFFLNKWRFYHNRNVIRHAKRRGLSCAGHALDQQQIEAVVACEDAQLVLAAAGSGKTLCLLAKLEYLVRSLHLPPKSILAISFTNKTVNELKERCAVEGVEIRTFHSLGNYLLRTYAPHRFSRATLVSETEIATFLKNKLSSLSKNSYLEFAASRDEFIQLVLNFLSLYKNGAWRREKLQDRLAQYFQAPKLSCCQKFQNFFNHPASPDAESFKVARTRAEHFLEIFFNIYNQYESWLRRKHFYDFSDMINAAKTVVASLARDTLGYRYILVDEIQDLSQNRSAFLKAILKNCPSCKLFAVGDDWQSIYRFSGSDLGLIQNFEAIFGLKTRRSLIESTHRFGEPTLSLSSSFIQKNPLQSFKRVTAPRAQTTPIYIACNSPPTLNHCQVGQDAATLSRLLNSLYQKHGPKELRALSIQLISRYNSDINRLRNAPEFTVLPSPVGTEVFNILWRPPKAAAPPFSLEFCSIHKAKGITRDYVFVLNVNGGLHGLPARRKSDALLEMLLVDSEKYPFAEERRLFYVAITRARRASFLICDQSNPSPFLFEISSEFAADFAPVTSRSSLASRLLVAITARSVAVFKKVLQSRYGEHHAQTNCAKSA